MIKVEKKIHKGWQELESLRKEQPDLFPSIIGKDHFTYEANKGKISLITLPDYMYDGKTLWEIYCLKGDLFEDCERFDSQKEAEKKIEELLGDKIE